MVETVVNERDTRLHADRFEQSNVTFVSLNTVVCHMFPVELSRYGFTPNNRNLAFDISISVITIDWLKTIQSKFVVFMNRIIF